MQLITGTVRIPLLMMMILVLFPTDSHAYIGPGLGLEVIGSVIGVFFSFFLAGVAVVWIPIKKLIRRLRKTEDEYSETVESRETSDKP